MLLPGFIHLGLLLMLATYSKGQDWGIDVTKRHQARPGSNIVVQCTYTYPEIYHTNDVKVTWKRINTERKICIKDDNNQNVFIFHHNKTCVDDEYRGRTSILGNQAIGNCTLQIKNVSKGMSMYLRIFAKEKYSFFKDQVHISVTGDAAITPNPDVQIVTGSFSSNNTGFQTNGSGHKLYVSILVPVAAVVITIIVVAVFFHIRYKRSLTITREDSGYYVNFSRGSADMPKKESISNKQDTTINEPESNDEPIYVNYEAATAENNQCEDPTENIYGNVDYLKN